MWYCLVNSLLQSFFLSNCLLQSFFLAIAIANCFLWSLFLANYLQVFFFAQFLLAGFIFLFRSFFNNTIGIHLLIIIVIADGVTSEEQSPNFCVPSSVSRSLSSETQTIIKIFASSMVVDWEY